MPASAAKTTNISSQRPRKSSRAHSTKDHRPQRGAPVRPCDRHSCQKTSNRAAKNCTEAPSATKITAAVSSQKPTRARSTSREEPGAHQAWRASPAKAAIYYEDLPGLLVDAAAEGSRAAPCHRQSAATPRRSPSLLVDDPTSKHLGRNALSPSQTST
mmetsp:Transcript_38094/g.83687  ORF Transcript_38094/g.83687 Transcript_38094/m.83687 type:complete len:158 (-) Transcript_38094:3-476(-)